MNIRKTVFTDVERDYYIRKRMKELEQEEKDKRGMSKTEKLLYDINKNLEKINKKY